MSATGGTHWKVRTALLLTAGAVAAGLAGCEYADDVGTVPAAAGPSARTPAASAPLPTRDPELVAAETRNLLTLDAVLGGLPEGLLFGGSGGIGDTSSGGFSVSGEISRAGRYKISAACIGAPDAHLSVIQGAREGGTLLERNLDCGSVTGALLVLEPGDVSAHLVRYGGGVPGPATGAVAGIRISFDGPGR
ncbi:hypothetical protein [Arthrobacter sp. Leaf69]|uniref:hypothetical protein n=1 Tax=Arthrobacter sp. Leaf69 TaxID=1736232 RepID=UPI0006FFC823|nr:hypothetical protein [Arthrobacter sp. Leaf69]KQN84511.1 hypothetical protein ASE96_17150 [Arthrobacter sp. Leaf69]